MQKSHRTWKSSVVVATMTRKCWKNPDAPKNRIFSFFHILLQINPAAYQEIATRFPITQRFPNSCGYFIEPTIVQAKDPLDKIMTEEIFGPVLSVYVYKDSKLDETMKLVENSTPYALTGAIFSQDL